VPDERRLEVLRAIVEDYVSSNEPVGSKALVERHDLGVSPATIRNDMAALEEEGLIVQPHTSAGRVPTDKGYRLFVDRLAEVRAMSTAERRAVQAFLDSAVDLDSVVERSVRLLAQLTHQMAMVQYPSLRRSQVRHVELVILAPRRLLLVLIADTGRVEQRQVEVPDELTEDAVAELRSRLNAHLHDQPFREISISAPALTEEFPPEQRPLAGAVLNALADAAAEQVEERIVVQGAANLARYGRDFPQSVHPILEALEEQVVLLRLLGEATATDEINVRIGHENDLAKLDAVSVITSGYGPPGQAVAHLGIVGPTRMDYPTSMMAVRAVARYVGRILAAQ
jgi:heat-inducible transcriptional repressor